MALHDWVLGLVVAQVAYTLYIIVERLYLSPLASIPGPKLAALTGWYECYYDLFKPAQYVFKIQELHKKYGPILRITPHEISIDDLQFLDTIYAPGQGAKRHKDASKQKGLGINTSIGGAIDHDLHRNRRESLNPFFSKASVMRLEPQLLEKIDQLREAFEDATKSKKPLNLADLYYAFSSDVVSQYSFGHNANNMADLARASKTRRNVQKVFRGVKFNMQFSWVREVISMLPPILKQFFVAAGVADMIRFRQRIRGEVEQILHEEKDKHNRGPPSVFRELRDSPTLPSIEKSPQRLEDEGTLLIIAGTESPAKAMLFSHFYLLSRPDIMSKLREELATKPSSTIAELVQLPYLRGIVAETHRLTFGLTGRQPRLAPEPLVYTSSKSSISYTIPPLTPVSMSTLLIHTNTEIFPDPWAFDPTRWYGQRAQEVKNKYLFSFSRGPRQCIGMHLANAELALAIREMAQWDMELYNTDEDDVKFLHDYHVATPKLDSEGVRVTVTGHKG